MVKRSTELIHHLVGGFYLNVEPRDFTGLCGLPVVVCQPDEFLIISEGISNVRLAHLSVSFH